MKCRQEAESIEKYFDGITHIKAPDCLTDKIMERIYKLDMPARPSHAVSNAANYPVFRRLGISMLLTAAIMIFSIFIPPAYGGAINSFAAERTSEIAERTNQISKTITKIDEPIKRLVDKISETFKQYQGGIK